MIGWFAGFKSNQQRDFPAEPSYDTHPRKSAGLHHAHAAGRTGAGHARGAMLSLRPDTVLLFVGSNNFPTRVRDGPPDLVKSLATEMPARHVKPSRPRASGLLQDHAFHNFSIASKAPLPCSVRLASVMSPHSTTALW